MFSVALFSSLSRALDFARFIDGCKYLYVLNEGEKDIVLIKIHLLKVVSVSFN
jgi:hypothetical protein